MELNEPLLPDDCPVYADYLYVVDGVPVRSDWHGITVAQFKSYMRAGEVRRCDIAGRRALAES
jgi:hypothetical protein